MQFITSYTGRVRSQWPLLYVIISPGVGPGAGEFDDEICRNDNDKRSLTVPRNGMTFALNLPHRSISATQNIADAFVKLAVGSGIVFAIQHASRLALKCTLPFSVTRKKIVYV